MPTIEALVFHKDGNRFLIPGMWSDGTDNTMSKAAVIIDSMMYRVCLGLDIKGTQDDWLVVEIGNDGHGDIPHAGVRMVSPALAHGGCDVLCISGPLFDDARARTFEPVE